MPVIHCYSHKGPEAMQPLINITEGAEGWDRLVRRRESH
jgi:hypothetical protein